MPSPFSQDIENMMNTISRSLDATVKTTAPQPTTAVTTVTESPLAAKVNAYAKYIVPSYVLLSIVLAILWTRYRTKKDEEGKTSKTSKPQPLSVTKVIMWTIVFNTPLIAWYYVRRSK